MLIERVLFISGGIGGVHHGASESFDVSADLTELGRTPVAVVSSGVIAFFDHSTAPLYSRST